MTLAIMAIDESAKMLNYPFNVQSKDRCDKWYLSVVTCRLFSAASSCRLHDTLILVVRQKWTSWDPVQVAIADATTEAKTEGKDGRSDPVRNGNMLFILIWRQNKCPPSLSSPGSIRSHHYLSALIRLYVVHQQLQRFPLTGFNQWKEIFWLQA